MVQVAVAAAAVAVVAGNTMKFAIILAVISIIGMIFGWWGHETASGEHYFREKTSAIPFFVGLASVIGFLIAIVVYSVATSSMHVFAMVLALLSIGGLIFGWWGLETSSGRYHFDEMAGMIPLFVGIASTVALPVAGAIYYFASR